MQINSGHSQARWLLFRPLLLGCFRQLFDNFTLYSCVIHLHNYLNKHIPGKFHSNVPAILMARNHSFLDYNKVQHTNMNDLGKFQCHCLKPIAKRIYSLLILSSYL